MVICTPSTLLRVYFKFAFPSLSTEIDGSSGNPSCGITTYLSRADHSSNLREPLFIMLMEDHANPAVPSLSLLFSS